MAFDRSMFPGLRARLISSAATPAEPVEAVWAGSMTGRTTISATGRGPDVRESGRAGYRWPHEETRFRPVAHSGAGQVCEGVDPIWDAAVLRQSRPRSLAT